MPQPPIVIPRRSPPPLGAKLKQAECCEEKDARLWRRRFLLRGILAAPVTEFASSAVRDLPDCKPVDPASREVGQTTAPCCSPSYLINPRTSQYQLRLRREPLPSTPPPTVTAYRRDRPFRLAVWPGRILVNPRNPPHLSWCGNDWESLGKCLPCASIDFNWVALSTVSINRLAGFRSLTLRPHTKQ